MLKNSNNYQGFTLIEVLVSMVIMGTGLLGLAMLQGRALSTNQDSYLYGQANLLAYEMSDRIKANKVFWGNTANAVPSQTLINAAKTDDTDGTPACTKDATATYTCLPDAMAAYDMYRWQADVARLLSTVTLPTVERLPRATSPTYSPPNCVAPATLCLTISWPTKTPNADKSVGTATQLLGMTP